MARAKRTSLVGSRRGSDAPALALSKVARKKPAKARAKEPAPPKTWAGVRITDAHLAHAGRRPLKSKIPLVHTLVSANHPPSVFPKGYRMAQDQIAAVDSSMSWAYQQMASAAFEEGLEFLGYPYLAEVAQRSEYRRISEIIATEMTRKWIRFQSKSPTVDKTERISELKDAFTLLDVQGAFREAAEQDGFFGRSHVYIDTGASDNPQELMTPIGNGHDDLSRSKVARGSLKRLKTVEAVWCYPSDYNSNDPLKPDWYKPKQWFVQGKRIDSSRLLTFIGREVPDLLKPAYSFGGLSLSQMAKPYIDNWLRTRQSVSDLIHSFSVFVLETDMSATMMEGNDQFFKRLDLFNQLRDNRGLMAINKDSEGFQNVSAPLGSLDHLQAQSQEHICSVTGIPLIKYTGITPSGLNASSEGELRTFYDWIAAYQEKFFNHNLTKVMHFVMLHLWGEVDMDIIYVYEPLWSLDAKAKAELRKMQAEEDVSYLGANILAPEEVRGRIASDPDSAYPGLDVNAIPDNLMPGEEEPGAEGEGSESKTEGEPGGKEEPEGEGKQPGFGMIKKEENTKPNGKAKGAEK